MSRLICLWLSITTALLLLLSGCSTMQKREENPLADFVVEFSDAYTEPITPPVQIITPKPKPAKPHAVKMGKEIFMTINTVKIYSDEDTLLYQTIAEWLGTPHRMGGNSKKGVDCSGFVSMLYQTLYGIKLPRSAADMAKQTTLCKSKDSLQTGDLLFFRIRGKRISHVGVYLKENLFAHSSTSQGVVISDLNDPYWSKTYTGSGKKNAFDHRTE